MAYEIRNAVHTHNPKMIDLEWLHPERGGWEGITAFEDDVEQHGRDLYTQALEGTVAPYVPPTAEESRALSPPITRRQLRLALVRNGISLTMVEATIAAIPDQQERDEATIEWADASSFERLHPLVLSVGSSLGLSEAQIDTMWTQAQVI